MKKLLAIIISAVMISALAVTSFAAPATTTGTVYDFVANFETPSAACFSFAVNHKTHGMMGGLTTKWYDGTQEMGPNLAGKHPASGGPLTGWGYYNNDGWGCCTGYYGGTNIVWASASQMTNIIVFTAPVSGLYSYDMEGSQYWDTGASSAKYYVEVAGEVHNENTASFEQGLEKDATKYNFEGTVELVKGETIYFCYDPEDSSSGDNGQINKLQVKLDRAGRTPMAVADGTVYDLIANFSEPDYCYFSLDIHEEGVGLLGATSTWYDGTDETVKHAGSGSALKGHYVVAEDKTADALGYFADGSLVWYPSGGGEYGLYSNVIIFTAPVAGTYSYEFTSSSYWKPTHSSADYFVSVNGGEFERKTVAKDTEVADSAVTFTGTVELAAGETIWYGTHAADSSAGDNNKLEKASVTLVEIDTSAPTPTPTPTPTPNPGTSDVAVSIAVAIAAAAVVGLAVVAKKH